MLAAATTAGKSHLYSQELLKLCAKQEIILEVEAGVVGGEEDGAAGAEMEHVPDSKLYTTPELRFVYDESVERGDKLSQLIDEANRKA